MKYFKYSSVLLTTLSLVLASEVEKDENFGPICGRTQRRSSLRESDSSRINHDFEIYSETDDTVITDNPLISYSGSRRPSGLFPNLAVDKPSSYLDDDNQSFIIDKDDADDEEEENIEDLINLIPERFIVMESSGIYPLDEADEFTSSAEVMKSRSSLYRLLSEIYVLFDTFDFEGFSRFFKSTPAAIKHQHLRYHLIENLMQRALKVSNEGTLQELIRFVKMIDTSSIAMTTADYEYTVYEQFKLRLNLSKLKKTLYDLFYEALDSYLKNEFNRIKPLYESISKGDYEFAKTIIASSNRSIWLSISDYFLLLKQSCSPQRYAFMVWAIQNGHFNVNERYGKELLTPLMFAAMNKSWSNDIVKAILYMEPSTNMDADSKGNKALQYAKNNSALKWYFRIPLINMLSLKNPTYEELNIALNK